MKIPIPASLLALLLASCTTDTAPATPPSRNAVILADTIASASRLDLLQDSLRAAGYRVLTSHTGDETARQVVQRLPWLLQPGVDLLYYDKGITGLQDSLKSRSLSFPVRAI